MERSRERSVERSSEGGFWMEYLHVSSDSDSFANRLSSSSYVDPPSFRLQLTPDTHHPESVPGSVPESVRPAGPAVHTFPEYIVMGNLRLESETRGIDVTRRAESIGEGIRVWGDV